MGALKVGRGAVEPHRVGVRGREAYGVRRRESPLLWGKKSKAPAQAGALHTLRESEAARHRCGALWRGATKSRHTLGNRFASFACFAGSAAQLLRDLAVEP